MDITRQLQQLRDNYKEIQTLYNRIHTTYLQQQEAFQKEDEEQVQAIIDQRDDYIEQTDNITLQITTITTEITQTLKIEKFTLTAIKAENYLLGEDLETLTNQIKTQLQETITLDKKLTQEMQTALGQNRQKRQDLQQGKKVYQAYNKNSSTAMFLDKQK